MLRLLIFVMLLLILLSLYYYAPNYQKNVGIIVFFKMKQKSGWNTSYGCENICEQSWDPAFHKYIQFLLLHGQKYQRSNAITETKSDSDVTLKGQLFFPFMHP